MDKVLSRWRHDTSSPHTLDKYTAAGGKFLNLENETMKPTKEQVEAYKSMAKQSPMSMESMIKAHLVANCPKFIESKFDGCLKYLTACAREILDSKSGEVADDVCYKICRDYFNDECEFTVAINFCPKCGRKLSEA